jgi:indolepyruvate ferredoxin oxidoreductase beta subunit
MNKNNKTNIIIAGVGGHGILTAAKILGTSSVRAGKKVMISEIHGMAQRGGAVHCEIRIGDIYGASIADGSADAIVATEPVEALRYISKIKKGGIVIADVNPVIPFTVSCGKEKYPRLDDVYEEIESRCNLIKVDGLKIAKECGSSICKNMVMLGCLAATKILPFDEKILFETMKESIPEKYKKMNESAFERGCQYVKKEIESR